LKIKLKMMNILLYYILMMRMGYFVMNYEVNIRAIHILVNWLICLIRVFQ
jgi:hypothetical protein